MLNLATKMEPNDESWLKDAEDNAVHRAKIFIDSGNHEKAAAALKEIPHKKALMFLYNLGTRYLKHNDKRAETVARTNDLIEKKKTKEGTISLHENKFPHSKHIPLFKRHTLAEIFEKEI